MLQGLYFAVADNSAVRVTLRLSDRLRPLEPSHREYAMMKSRVQDYKKRSLRAPLEEIPDALENLVKNMPREKVPVISKSPFVSGDMVVVEYAVVPLSEIIQGDLVNHTMVARIDNNGSFLYGEGAGWLEARAKRIEFNNLNIPRRNLN